MLTLTQLAQGRCAVNLTYLSMAVKPSDAIGEIVRDLAAQADVSIYEFKSKEEKSIAELSIIVRSILKFLDDEYEKIGD